MGERIVLLTWEAIDQIVDDEWEGMTPALRSAVHSLRQYSRAMGDRIAQLSEPVSPQALSTLSTETGEKA